MNEQITQKKIAVIYWKHLKMCFIVKRPSSCCRQMFKFSLLFFFLFGCCCCCCFFLLFAISILGSLFFSTNFLVSKIKICVGGSFTVIYVRLYICSAVNRRCTVWSFLSRLAPANFVKHMTVSFFISISLAPLHLFSLALDLCVCVSCARFQWNCYFSGFGA